MFTSRDLCRGRSRRPSGDTSLDPILGASRGPNWSTIMFPSRDLCRGRRRSPSGGISLDPLLRASRGPNWSTIMFQVVICVVVGVGVRLVVQVGSDSGCKSGSELE
jgi:hypothetical protein